MTKVAGKDTAAAEADLAKKLLAGKRDATTTIATNDIPETVKIGSLSKDYEPSVLPHRKIVLAMLEGMKDSKLAGAFHAYWNVGNERPDKRFIVAQDAKLTGARLFLAAQIGQIVKNGLSLLGVEAVEEM